MSIYGATWVPDVFCKLPFGYDGSITLHEYPDDMVRLACDKCGRRGQYWKRSLLIRFAYKSLPELRVEIAKCERQTSMVDPCGMHYVGLT